MVKQFIPTKFMLKNFKVMQILNTMEGYLIAYINKEIGQELKNLRRANVLMMNYKSTMELSKLKLTQLEGTELTPNIKSTSHNQRTYVPTIDIQIVKIAQYHERLLNKIGNSDMIFRHIIDDLEKVHRLQQLKTYLKIVRDIQEASQSLTSIIHGKDDAKLVNIYLTLFEDNDGENSVIGRLSGIQAFYLKMFASKTATYWHKILSDKFSSELQSILNSMRWGFKEYDSQTFSSSRDNTIKVQLLAEFLFLIKSPTEDHEPMEVITPSITYQPVGVVTKLLLAPFRVRFLYHFSGIRQTNRLDKPEWFFTQVLNWAKVFHLFVGKTFQPAAVKAGILNANMRLEFIRGLIQLIIEKLSADIEEISNDEFLFAHLLDEILAFEAELRERFGYPSSLPSVVCVVTQPVYLMKWISLEERLCAEKVNLILNGENPWALIGRNFDDHHLKIPRCADQFIRLLEAIKDRYYSLIQPGHQLQFLSLQLELIENFRRRLMQFHFSGEVDSISIVNAINYVAMVLREWGESLHYLHLHVALMGANSNEICSVFDKHVIELEQWIGKLIEGLATKVVNEIKAKSMPYRHDCWSSMPQQSCKEPFILSPSAGEMFQVIVTTLHNLEHSLSVNLFNLTVRIVANQVDDFLFESLVMNNKFTTGGAAQLNYDMSRNLFALFGQYCRRSALLFKRVHESNKLLNANRGTAILIYDTLINEITTERRLETLSDIGIVNLNYQTCIEVLKRRLDMGM